MNEREQRLASHFFSGVDELVFWSFRYFVGRMTISTCVFAQDLARAWPDLGVNTKKQIRDELERAFEEDDALQKEFPNKGMGYRRLGWDCDRAAWEKVREAYKKEGECHEWPKPSEDYDWRRPIPTPPGQTHREEN